MVHSTHAEQLIGITPPAYDPAAAHWRIDTVGPNGNKHGDIRTVRLDAQRHIFSELWLVHGGKHAWYGGDAKAGQVDPSGPDAAGEMTHFFADPQG